VLHILRETCAIEGNLIGDSRLSSGPSFNIACIFIWYLESPDFGRMLLSFDAAV